MAEQKNHKQNTSELPIPSIAGLGRSGGGPTARFMRPVIKPKDLKAVVKRLWSYFKGEYGMLLALIFMVFLSSIVTLAIPFLLGKAIDILALPKQEINLEIFKNLLFIMGIVYGLDAFISVFQGFIMAEISKRILTKLRSHLFSKLQKLSVAFFDTHTHGEVMSRLTNDIENISTTISGSLSQLIAGSLTILGAFGMMLFLSPVLTLASLITLPLVYLLSKTIASKTKFHFKNQQIALGKLNGCIEESITGMSVIRAFNREEQTIATFEHINEQLFKAGLKAQMLSGFLMPLMNVINNLGFVAVAGVGGLLAVHHVISVGVIASFLSYSRQFSRPLNELANIFNLLQSALAGAERVFEVLDEQEEGEDESGAVPITRPKGNML